jgi:hypothetical protein
LPGQPASRNSDGSSDSKLVLSGCAPRKEEIGDIGASDQYRSLHK